MFFVISLKMHVLRHFIFWDFRNVLCNCKILDTFK